MRTARTSIGVNIALSAFKLFAGIVANSAAMVADAIHSITDLVSTVIVIIGIRMAGKQPDKDHPYGHERFECVATLLLAALITVVGVGLGWAGVQTIIAGDFNEISVPGLLALIAAVVSIGAKEGLFWYVRAAAKKIDSSSLMADAWHSRADGLSSIGSFIGILGARMGFPILDPVAAIVICIFILKTALSIAKDAIGKMTDRSCSEETEEEMHQIIQAHGGVEKIDRLHTRMFGNRIYVDVDISVDGSVSLEDAHNIAQDVHDDIERQFSKVKHCMVHINPSAAGAGSVSTL